MKRIVEVEVQGKIKPVRRSDYLVYQSAGLALGRGGGGVKGICLKRGQSGN